MRWSSIGAFAATLLFSGVIAFAVSSMLVVRFGDLSAAYAVIGGYTISAIVCFIAAYFFAPRTGSKPYLSALLAYLLSSLVAAGFLQFIADSLFFSWTWLVDFAWAMLFLMLGTALALWRLRLQSRQVGA